MLYKTENNLIFEGYFDAIFLNELTDPFLSMTLWNQYISTSISVFLLI